MSDGRPASWYAWRQWYESLGIDRKALDRAENAALLEMDLMLHGACFTDVFGNRIDPTDAHELGGGHEVRLDGR